MVERNMSYAAMRNIAVLLGSNATHKRIASESGGREATPKTSGNKAPSTPMSLREFIQRRMSELDKKEC